MTDEDRQQNLFQESEEIRSMFDKPDERDLPVPPPTEKSDEPPTSEKGFQ
jgi:hypothetical protein